MKAKITDVGIPFNNQGVIGFNVGFEWDGSQGVAFIQPGDDFKAKIAEALKEENDRLWRLEAATVLADNIRKRIGTEIDLG